MPGAAAAVAPGPSIAPEDTLRAQWYRLLARFLSLPPSSAELQAAAALVGGDSEFGRAIAGFARACAGCDPERVAREFHDLFIGLSRGLLVPYGSYYLSGFLHEKPLAKLRQDMARLGVARAAGVADPEDHIASLLEMMAVFIEGSCGRCLSLAEQKDFFATHIGNWAAVFFRDLEAAEGSLLYAALGTVGRSFLAIEEDAFAMV
jgi:TorA maturation chaperone TorD